jgi:hypothetical protein
LIVPAIPFAVWVGWRAPKYGEGYFQFLRYHSLELLAIELAISGIAYAWHHDDKLDKQVNQLRDQAQKLRMLEGSLSTYRKGPFPKYLRDIGELARKARKDEHLDILVDCLDYGSFFAPKIHQKVQDQICDAKSRGVMVRFLVCGEAPEHFTGTSGLFDGYDAATRAKLLKKYNKALVADTGFKTFVCLLSSSKNFETFATTWFKSELRLEASQVGTACTRLCRDLTARDDDTLITLLQVRQLWFAAKLRNSHVAIQSLPQSEPMFFWIKYEEGAGKEITDNGLFTFANASRGPKQLGYVTHDPDLLATLSTTFKEKWEIDPKKVKDLRWLEFLKNVVLD